MIVPFYASLLTAALGVQAQTGDPVCLDNPQDWSFTAKIKVMAAPNEPDIEDNQKKIERAATVTRWLHEEQYYGILRDVVATLRTATGDLTQSHTVADALIGRHAAIRRSVESLSETLRQRFSAHIEWLKQIRDFSTTHRIECDTTSRDGYVAALKRFDDLTKQIPADGPLTSVEEETVTIFENLRFQAAQLSRALTSAQTTAIPVQDPNSLKSIYGYHLISGFGTENAYRPKRTTFDCRPATGADLLSAALPALCDTAGHVPTTLDGLPVLLRQQQMQRANFRAHLVTYWRQDIDRQFYEAMGDERDQMLEEIGTNLEAINNVEAIQHALFRGIARTSFVLDYRYMPLRAKRMAYAEKARLARIQKVLGHAFADDKTLLGDWGRDALMRLASLIEEVEAPKDLDSYREDRAYYADKWLGTAKGKNADDRCLELIDDILTGDLEDAEHEDAYGEFLLQCKGDVLR